ncbi:MAG: type II secretion system protein GspM [Myxococcota bacterium]
MASVNRLQDWWEGISPREQRMIAILIITGIVAVTVFIGLQIRDRMAALEQKNEDTRFALEALHSYRLNKANEPIAPQVPIPDEPTKLETYLEGIASEVNVSIPEFKPVSPQTKNGFVETSRRIRLNNVTVYQFKDFLEKIENRSKVVVVKDMTITTKFNANDRLNVDLVISTYSKEKKDDEESEEKVK